MTSSASASASAMVDRLLQRNNESAPSFEQGAQYRSFSSSSSSGSFQNYNFSTDSSTRNDPATASDDEERNSSSPAILSTSSSSSFAEATAQDRRMQLHNERVASALSMPGKASSSSCDHEDSAPQYKFKAAFRVIGIETLPSAVLLHCLQFLDLASLKNCMRVNRYCHDVLMSTDVHWKERCKVAWPFMFLSPELGNLTIVNDLDLSRRRIKNVVTAGSGDPASSSSSTDFTSTTGSTAADSSENYLPNYPRLLSLAAAEQPTGVDEALFTDGTQDDIRLFTLWLVGEVALDATRLVFPTLEMVRVRTNGTHPQTTNSTFRTAVRFNGAVNNGDRCIRANAPLPRPTLNPRLVIELDSDNHVVDCRDGTNGQQAGTDARRNSQAVGISFWKPFVSPYLDINNQVHLTPRCISYFEVSILPSTEAVSSLRHSNDDDDNEHPHHPRRFQEQQQPQQQDDDPVNETVAVGIGRSNFPMHHFMPGWTKSSYGYHGDDGGFFHGKGHAIQDAFGPPFSVGDTVGCGIQYCSNDQDFVAQSVVVPGRRDHPTRRNGGGPMLPKARLFYTLNGEWLGYAAELSFFDVEEDWYPVIGIDTTALVQFNFTGPFQFDLTDMILKQHQYNYEGPRQHMHV